MTTDPQSGATGWVGIWVYSKEGFDGGKDVGGGHVVGEFGKDRRVGDGKE